MILGCGGKSGIGTAGVWACLRSVISWTAGVSPASLCRQDAGGPRDFIAYLSR